MTIQQEQTIKRTINTTVQRKKAGMKEARKAFAYYGKNTKSYYKAFIAGLPKDIKSAGVTAFASSRYMKNQYQLWYEQLYERVMNK